ncbi:hypothetical protein OS189_05525 [Sulfitobacter sp. F26169L]|uniref:hypothetical protein n=1 Tax=Sulfitobacter sp. F26169L TaxID=2996015 RepID=UPI002260E93B|nr:hypothetical protein [Sulfitobacter sp. F26169L]MCX7565795.1 hypothetical protein [Sulfitobacter sp. F26169L]
MMAGNIDLEQLDFLLERERSLLLKGDLTGLGTLLEAKEEMVEMLLKDTETQAEKIIPLEGKLRRNQLLLNGALHGVRSVAKRLAALRQVQTTLETYDAQGRKQDILADTKPKLEKRS